MTDADLPSAAAIIAQLGLSPHPEGGWYRETWRDTAGVPPRGHASLILYLLEKGQRSHWHRIDASEIWLHQGGGTLQLHTWDGGAVSTERLGSDLLGGEKPQAVVAPGAWQSADTQAPWALVACVVAPGFDFARFEMAPAGWSPPRNDAP